MAPHPRVLPVLRGVVLTLAGLVAGCGGGGGGGTDLCPGFASPGTNTGGSFTVSGTILYEDRLFDAGGFTGGSASVSARKVAVEVVRCSDGTVLNSGKTLADGTFAVTATNTGAIGVYVRALTRIAETDYTVTVKDQSSDATYAVRGTGFDERAAPVQALTALAADGIGAPFNILDQALTAIEYMEATLPLPGSLSPLTIRWEAETTAVTAFYPATKTIYVLDQPNAALPDTDGYDDLVVLHEVGHYLAAELSQDDSLGGVHGGDETDQDARLAWSEGWGNFFAGAAGGTPDYVDTYDPVVGGSKLYFSLEDKGSSLGGATSELGVARTLWDGIDGPGDTDADPVSLGDDQILTAFENLTPADSPVTFGRFWNAFRVDTVTNSSADITGLRAAALSNGIDLYEDGGTDDVVGDATSLGGGFPRSADANLAWDATAGSTPDTDYYTTSLTGGTTYTIETTALWDGADTFLEVLDAAGTTVLKFNDNYDGTLYPATCGEPGQSACPPNGPDPLISSPEPLSSSLTFTPSSTASYVIRLTRSSVAPPSAGLFGDYTLRISN